ncbi:hypothetical protein E4U58_005777 [Claviceps cyperi]|nr:hypothetical protein E4U58_005777 [Claviceps cyperi]
MASSRPGSDPLLMFGYSVDTSQENLFDGAPEPAPGTPLLTETDSKALSCFFQDMTSNQYNTPSFGEGLNFSDAWLDLPPQFMGSSTSFGSQEDPTVRDFGFPHDQQNDGSRMLSTSSSMMPPPPPPPPPPAAIAPSLHPTPSLSQTQPQTFQPSQHQQHSDDVLNAAATLLRNGSRACNGQSLGDSSQDGSIRDSESNGRRSSAPFPMRHLQHQPMEEFKEQTRRSSQVAETEHSLTGWMFGSKQQKATHPAPAVGDIQWGSDARFTDVQGYVPEPTVESVEAMHQQQMKFLDSLAIEPRAANPRPSSAVNSNGTGDVSSNCDAYTHTTRKEKLNAPPRKRRKSRNVPRSTIEEEHAGDDDYAASTKSVRKRKTRPERSASGSEPPPDATAITAGGPRRRKSGTAAAAAKPPRENLSEEQKRENHIRSEQKRRTLIKQGFDDLGVLVPGLRGGGLSKSTTLTMAADWLEQLLQGNKALALQAEALERR